MNWLNFNIFTKRIHESSKLDLFIKRTISDQIKFHYKFIESYKSNRYSWEHYTMSFLSKYINSIEGFLLNKGVPPRFIYELRQVRQYDITNIEQKIIRISSSKMYESNKERDDIFFNLIKPFEELMIINWESTLNEFSDKELEEMFLDHY